ncbi:MAG: IS1634 family transposase [Fulvivirga sp.]
MFVRKKPNKSGVVSVQVIDKSSGRYRVIKTIGSSTDASEIERLEIEGRQWITHQKGVLSLDLNDLERQADVFFDHIESVKPAGTDLLLGKIFDEIGFSAIASPLFKSLVLSRIANPVSKLKTTDYWFEHYGVLVSVAEVYRYLDKLHKEEKPRIEQISFEHTRQVLGTAMLQMVFYDVTTIYFEAEQEDELRKTGFSKDGKHQHPQIVLGLLVSNEGYPLAYDIFEGNKYEGDTMLPIVDAFKEKYDFKQITIIADAGLLSKSNVKELEEKQYAYILGARIKNESEKMKEKILALPLEDGQSAPLKKGSHTSLIIHYSKKRANKDAHNRERGLKRLEKLLQTGKLTKANINNRGYNKYLKMIGDVEIRIDQDKFEQDARWDGLKGYQTNTKLTGKEVITHYQELWKIEKAFRISKHDLKIRPIYHRARRRIEAHICLSFAAYKIYKELERQLKVKKMNISPEKAIDIARTIYKIQIRIDKIGYFDKVLLLNEKHRWLNENFGLKT